MVLEKSNLIREKKQIDFRTGEKPCFFVVGDTGFIFPKHKEAIESIGGRIVNNMDDADWIVVLTPNYNHYWQIVEALKRGKNVLCEKPLVISSTECNDIISLKENKKVFSVFQLRHLPAIKEIKPLENWNEIDVFVEVYRDDDYLKSWKADPEKSGGILFNLGIHYFDLILNLFGEPIETRRVIIGPRENTGIVRGNNYICRYIFSYKASKDQQRRVFRINGKDYNLETKDNLHKQVYQDLIDGRGITPEDNLKVISLIEKLQ